MSQLRTLVTASTLAAHSFGEDHLKLCFLWYGEVICETVNDYHKTHFIEQILNGEELESSELNDLTDIVVTLDDRLSEHARRAVQPNLLSPIGYPRWGTNEDPYANYTYPDPADAQQYAHNALLKKIHAEHGVESYRDVRAEQVEGRARVAVDGVRTWNIVNQELACMFQANDDERAAIRAMAECAKPEDPRQLDAFQLLELGVPSLARTPWKEVVRIRRKGKFDSLRDKMSEILQGESGDLDSARAALKQAEDTATSEIIEQYRPTVKQVVAETLLGSLPIPFNPVGALLDARDLYQEIKRGRALNWFYLLRDIRAIAR